MFAYLFGGAISGNVQKYLPLLIPGIVAQTVLTTCMSTGVNLREDMEKGVFDRFKALPMSRIAPLAGPMVADLVRYLIAAGLTFVTGVIIGYRPGGGVLGVLGAMVLAIFTGWALAWIFTWIGTIARSARAVQGMSMMILFPLTFLSNAFVPVTSLPGWLAAFVKINPVSHLVSATRGRAPTDRRAVAELAVVIGTPGPYRSQAGDETLGERRHRRVAPGGDLGNPGQSGDLDRHVAVSGGAVAQLAGAVLAPRPDGSVGAQCQDEPPPGRDLGDSGEPLHVYRPGAVAKPAGGNDQA
jgi:ABC transporter DrrB family efflux protein